jgi:ribosome-associated protein
MRYNKIVKAAIVALEDIKARDIIIIDVRKQTSLYDTIIVATAESSRQTKALSTHVREAVRDAGGQIIGSEGETSGDWVLVDAEELVVHIMQPAVRAYYKLEDLWTLPMAKSVKQDNLLESLVKPAKKTSKKVGAKKSAAKKTAAKKTTTQKVAAKKTGSKKALAIKAKA